MPTTTDTFLGTAAPLTQAGFDDVARRLEVDGPSLWSLLAVETSGFGYLPDRRPKILFERHIFHRRTGGRFGAAHPDISSKASGGYSNESGGEYVRLAQAMQLDRTAAVESASWGLGQVMGFNAVDLGYLSADEMIAGFMQGEDAQLEGSRRFIAGNHALATAFRARKWSMVAFLYNGPEFAKNQYDVKLQRNFEEFTATGTPSLEIRATQIRLTYLGFDPKGVDGVVGKGTHAALVAFQTANGLAPTGGLTDATMQALKDKSKV